MIMCRSIARIVEFKNIMKQSAMLFIRNNILRKRRGKKELKGRKWEEKYRDLEEITQKEK
ncbi:hypothetical protein H5410_027029 [Solanum commersonii]|uniref:Uncharacterized protein n=1 Tax=Solanum commersonii TaxID=4109 RepID=A0A9J5YY43_SOLCO|nr:hypothetical protein H5410_027029 [Solanum commersonii]